MTREIPRPLLARLHGALRRLLRAHGGATAVEFGLVAPVFVVFLLGICEFGRAIWEQAQLQAAVESASRCYAINANNSFVDCYTADTTKTYAAAQITGFTTPTSEYTITTPGSCGSTANPSARPVTVSAAHPFDPIVPQLVPGLSITLNAKSCHP